MELAIFLSRLPRPERDGFAAACGSTFARLRQIAYGNEAASPQLCVAIDRESMGEVAYHEVNSAWLRRGGQNDGRRRIQMDWRYIEEKVAKSLGQEP